MTVKRAIDLCTDRNPCPVCQYVDLVKRLKSATKAQKAMENLKHNQKVLEKHD